MKPNFEYMKELPEILPEPMVKELFMANLGMWQMQSQSPSASDSTSSTLISNTSGRTSSSRPTRQTLREERRNPYGMLQTRLMQVQDGIWRALRKEQEELEIQQQPRQQPLHKMLLWLMDLPQRIDISRISFSSLRCNECHLCEGVEYPCVRCHQQFHQECHEDQGRRQPHRLCPACTRHLIENKV